MANIPLEQTYLSHITFLMTVRCPHRSIFCKRLILVSANLQSEIRMSCGYPRFRFLVSSTPSRTCGNKIASSLIPRYDTRDCIAHIPGRFSQISRGLSCLRGVAHSLTRKRARLCACTDPAIARSCLANQANGNQIHNSTVCSTDSCRLSSSNYSQDQ